jgi:hypothetical protein
MAARLTWRVDFQSSRSPQRTAPATQPCRERKRVTTARPGAAPFRNLGNGRSLGSRSEHGSSCSQAYFRSMSHSGFVLSLWMARWAWLTA